MYIYVVNITNCGWTIEISFYLRLNITRFLYYILFFFGGQSVAKDVADFFARRHHTQSTVLRHPFSIGHSKFTIAFFIPSFSIIQGMNHSCFVSRCHIRIRHNMIPCIAFSYRNCFSLSALPVL